MQECCERAPVAPEEMAEDPRYLREQLITYIGSKRALLPFIGGAVERVRQRLGGRKLRFLDIFAGTGIVSRSMKRHSSLVIANDLEAYSRVTSQCYLANAGDLDLAQIAEACASIDACARENEQGGFIRELYAPRDDGDIRRGERVFYTVRNAAYLDAARQAIGRFPQRLHPFLLAPLLSEASVHVNTSGVFKGFYKDGAVGRFGGRGGNALPRILGEIRLEAPVLSRHACECIVHQADANALAPTLPEVDLAYLDPPYNQHPYGSNYFLLNLLVDYVRPAALSPVSGIPRDWKRSAYYKRRESAETLFALVESIRAKYCLISYSSEGFIGEEEFLSGMRRIGKVEVCETPYNAFRGSRNLHARPKRLTEFLYLVEK